jgi:hypothetical protein
VDEHGVRCRQTTEQWFTDGWTNGDWGPLYPAGYYCPRHAAALNRVKEQGGLEWWEKKRETLL